jgi:hypothetical protein
MLRLTDPEVDVPVEGLMGDAQTVAAVARERQRALDLE